MNKLNREIKPLAHEDTLGYIVYNNTESHFEPQPSLSPNPNTKDTHTLYNISDPRTVGMIPCALVSILFFNPKGVLQEKWRRYWRLIKTGGYR